MAKQDRYYLYLDDEGDLNKCDLESGETTKQDEKLFALNSEENQLDMVDAKHFLDKAWVPKSTSLADIKSLCPHNRPLYYSAYLAEIFLERYRSGVPMTDLCKQKEFPTYSTLCKWRREVPEFSNALKYARQDRGEVYFDKVLSEVEEATQDRDSINLAKLRADVYKYAAKVSNQDDFGEKTQIKAEVSHTQYVIETGIRRVNDPGYMPDETLKLVEEELILKGNVIDGEPETN